MNNDDKLEYPYKSDAPSGTFTYQDEFDRLIASPASLALLREWAAEALLNRQKRTVNCQTSISNKTVP